MQKLLNANHNDLKNLRESNFNLEGEKQELENNLVLTQKKIQRQLEEIARLEKCNKDLRSTQEELERELSAGEDAVQMQASRAQRELSTLRKENESLTENINKIMDCNNELTTTA